MNFRRHVALTLIIGCGSVAAAAPSIELADCEIPELGRAARCGTLDVPENPAKPDGRRLPINVVVIPA